jgi:hypothetical protein
MTTVTNIFNSAYNKDAVSLKSQINDIMNSRIEDAISNLQIDISSSVFGNTNGEEEIEDELEDEGSE